MSNFWGAVQFSDGLFKRLPIWLWNNIVLSPIFKRKECFSISL